MKLLKNENKSVCEYACLSVQGTAKTSYDSATIHSPDLLHSKDVQKPRDNSRTFLCHVYGTSIDPESGLWSLFFDNSRAQLSSSKRTVSVLQPCHLIVLLLAGRVITKQPRGMLAPSGQGISKLGCYLGFQIWKKPGKHFLLMFHQLKAAAAILQHAIFRSRRGEETKN